MNQLGLYAYYTWKYKETLPVYLSLFQTSKNVMFFFLSFIFFLLQNQRTGGWNRSCKGEDIDTSWRGEVEGKGGRMVNTVHMYINTKMVPVETLPGIEGGEINDPVMGSC
jgi:hypothetical protein